MNTVLLIILIILVIWLLIVSIKQRLCLSRYLINHQIEQENQKRKDIEIDKSNHIWCVWKYTQLEDYIVLSELTYEQASKLVEVLEKTDTRKIFKFNAKRM